MSRGWTRAPSTQSPMIQGVLDSMRGRDGIRTSTAALREIPRMAPGSARIQLVDQIGGTGSSLDVRANLHRPSSEVSSTSHLSRTYHGCPTGVGRASDALSHQDPAITLRIAVDQSVPRGVGCSPSTGARVLPPSPSVGGTSRRSTGSTAWDHHASRRATPVTSDRGLTRKRVVDAVGVVVVTGHGTQRGDVATSRA